MASPVNRLPRLAPPPDSSPRPSECARSIPAASVGEETRTIRSRSLSYQRKPGMSALDPCRMPQTEAPVCELQSVCQEVSTWLPERSQAARLGIDPSRTARRAVSWESASICRNSTPGGHGSG